MKFLDSREVVAKILNMYPFVHTKKIRQICIFTSICVHLGVVIRVRGFALVINTSWKSKFGSNRNKKTPMILSVITIKPKPPELVHTNQLTWHTSVFAPDFTPVYKALYQQYKSQDSKQSMQLLLNLFDEEFRRFLNSCCASNFLT